MTVYTWLNKQGVRSSEGYTVQVTGRFSVEYRDEKGVVTVAVECAPGSPTTTCTYERRSFDSLPAPHQQVAVDNFRDAVRFMGLDPIERAT